ncbi:LysM peptidoglycan-binding domain-containing protein, partial [Kitasatospora sp. GP82]|uniref:LysM peptidoglycan-binding domain-containing protein n=1 Tax=Kitasatospora sp. GP82 TaxID=3035089 RepID=UPI0024759D4C
MPRRTTSRLADAARGLAALIALLALLIGVPLLLLRTGVLPAGITSWHDVTTALSLPDDGTLFLGALTLIGWAAWLSFVSSVVMEAGAVLRHRKAPRIRVLGATQRLASSLVAGVVLLLPASAAFAASPTTGAVSVSTTTGLHQTGATQAATAPATSSAQAWTGRIHQVRTGDTLWDLAEHYLGSGTRWHEIAGVNDGIRQSDGTLMTGNILDLQPGWLLRLPATAEAPATGEHLVVVQPGDTLSQIAQDELGDGNLFPKLLEATRDRVQPDGSHLTDPDRLLPGEVIVIPATATPDAPPLAAKPSPVVPAPTEAPPRPPAATPPSAPTAPPSTQPQAPSHAPSMANPQTDPGQTTPTSQAPDKADTTPPPAATGDDAAIPAQQTVAGIAAILGAALLSVIAWRRREQQRHRQPGETIAMPEETSQAEQALDRISSPASVELLDRALRTLAHQHPDALPVIRGAKVAAARVEIRVDDEDTEALSPFTDRPGGWWGLRADRASLLTAQQASTVPAPYPGLTTIGADTDGALLLAHLPFSGVLLLDGTDQQVREVARGIAMEAGTAVWADHIEVMTCGFGLELQELLPQSRVMFSPGLPAATEDLARVLIEAHQAEHEGGEPPQPWLLVCAVVPSAEELYAFADLMGKACGQRIAAVLPADGARDLFPDAEVLDAGSTEPQGLEVLETEVVLQRVTDEAYRQLTATMTTAVEPPVQAEGAWAHVPNPEERRFGPGAVGTTTASRSHLSLLAAPDEPEPTKETDAMTDAVADEEPAGPVAQPAQSEGTLPHNIPAADSAHNQAAPAGGPHTHHTLGKVSGSGLSRTDLSKTARVSIVRDN